MERDSRTTSDKGASSPTLTTAAQTEVPKTKVPASLSSPKASVDQIGTANPAAQGSPDFSSIHETAQQGDAEAQNTLGLLYEKGQGVARDYVQAAAWYRLAAEQGNADAQCNLARLYLRGLLGAGPAGIDYGDAFYWYRLAADQGSAIAEVAVGNLYFSSLGVPPQMENYTLAIYWCTKAAEQGNPYAEESLGRFYSDPHGAGYWNVQPDFIKSFYWRHKAAEDGNGMAQAEPQRHGLPRERLCRRLFLVARWEAARTSRLRTSAGIRRPARARSRVPPDASPNFRRAGTRT